MRNESQHQNQPMLLTLPAAAKMVGLGARTLYRFSQTGRAPRPIKLTPGSKSGCSRYRRVDLEKWVASGCRPWEV